MFGQSVDHIPHTFTHVVLTDSLCLSLSSLNSIREGRHKRVKVDFMVAVELVL